MRAFSLLGPAAACSCFLVHIFVVVITLELPISQATLFTPVTQPDLDLSQLGRIVLTGNFEAISLFLYEQQSENLVTNGSHSLITPLPNGFLAGLSSSDGHISAMCALSAKNGSLVGVFVGGNFTSLGGVESQGIALFDPASNTVRQIRGIAGKVQALYCDQESGIVYVGGEFNRSNSSNAIAWSDGSGIMNLPFGGFNGPVTSIVKTGDGHVVFGGSFDGLGNTTTPSLKDQQVINLETARISSGSSTTLDGFQDPRNVICKTSGEDGAGNTWLLADNSPGFWRAEMSFGFRPTKLRVWNTHKDGRGTKTFRFTAVPDNGILNMTYNDPASGEIMACDAQCPLSNSPTERFRDFHLVNDVGMNGFQLDISDWYGAGGGFTGVELFQDDIYAFAVNDFNEPTCANIGFGSKASATGNWVVVPSRLSSSGYLTAKVTSSDSSSTSLTFQPDIKQSGNYSVTIFTPGCIQDGTCGTRGVVNVTTTLSAQNNGSIEATIFQTNYYDKYDQIYLGYVDTSGPSFRPTVKLAAKADQGDMDMVASRVRFELISSTGGLNGLFEFNPGREVVATDFSNSPINRAGTDLEPGASITSLALSGDILFIGGHFSNSSFGNIMAISNGKAPSLLSGGLNSPVSSMLVLNDTLFVGGNFSDTFNGGNSNLQNVGAYSLSSKSWAPLGGGVNGRVSSLVQFPLNVTRGIVETTVAVSGDFNKILAFDNNPSVPVSGFAVWVPSRKNWLENLEIDQMAFNGHLSASIVGNVTTLLAGNLTSAGIASRDVVTLTEKGGLALQRLPANIQQTETQPSRKRAAGPPNITGVVTGLFDTHSGRNLTILGGRFSAKASNGSIIENLIFLNGSSDNAVTGSGAGFDAGSTFVTMGIQGDTLFVGGDLKGNVSGSAVNGLILYDLAKEEYVATQPPALVGDSVVVNSIAPHPASSDVYIGGQFELAGSLPCPSVCNFETSAGQWSQLGFGLKGTVSGLKWVTNEKLIAAGNLTVGDNETMIATYDLKMRTWSVVNGTSSATIPGPVTALCASKEDGSRYWVAGQSTNGSTFLSFYDGSGFRLVTGLFGEKTIIRDIQVLVLRKNHGSSDLLDKDQVLLVTGHLRLPNFGSASAALFNGTTLTPFILSTTANGQPGTISQLFTENKNTFSSGRHHHPKGIVILVSFCLALACIFLIVLIGIILNRVQRYRQGYAPAPQGTDRRPDLTRVPPEYLLSSLRQRVPGAPAV